MAMIGPRRKPGRRPLDPTDSSTYVCLSLPGKFYDQLYQAARQERVTVPELVRRIILPRRRPDPAPR